jgi:thiamine pyrophosphate-dependent acetolactate synthase large subunit-like protein
MLAGAKMWPKIDVALAVGTRFITQMLFWGRDDYIKLIRIDPDATQSIDPWKPDVHLVTTGKKALGALALRLPHQKRRDKIFFLLYNWGHEKYNQYQRDTEHPWKRYLYNRMAFPEQGKNPHTTGQRAV